jgi:hypothetical protein
LNRCKAAILIFNGETVPRAALSLRGAQATRQSPSIRPRIEVLDKPVYAYSNFLHAIRNLPVRIAA